MGRLAGGGGAAETCQVDAGPPICVPFVPVGPLEPRYPIWETGYMTSQIHRACPG